MAFRGDKRPAPDQIDVVIGRRASFSGQLRSDASIRVDGTVEGGMIETPFPELVYVTVPREEVEEIKRGLTPQDKERMVETMHGKIREAFRRR